MAERESGEGNEGVLERLRGALEAIAEKVGLGGGAEDEAPLEGYDEMSVAAVREQLGDMGEEEIRALRDYEEENKNRVTLLRALDARLGENS